MADDKPVVDASAIRKTLSFTHRQLGIAAGGGILSALAIVGQLKGFFITREEGKAMANQIAEVKENQYRGFDEIKKMYAVGQEDQIHKLERLNDKVIDRIKDAEARAMANDALQAHRIDTIEQVVLLGGKSKVKHTD